jgi:hypothetical protein
MWSFSSDLTQGKGKSSCCDRNASACHNHIHLSFNAPAKKPQANVSNPPQSFCIGVLALSAKKSLQPRINFVMSLNMLDASVLRSWESFSWPHLSTQITTLQ